MSMQNVRRMPLHLFSGGLLFLLLTCIVCALLLGPVKISWDTFLLHKKALSAYEQTVLWQLRLPRLLLALCVGGVLALCGAVMQGLFRNPLADPGITGVSTGAALGAVLSLVWFPQAGVVATPLCAFIGSLISVVLVWRLAHSSQGTSVVMLLLAGVAIAAVGGAAMGYLSYVADDQALRNISLWQMGSVSGANYATVALVALALCVLLVCFCFYSSALNALSLGEAEARHLGIDVEKMKKVLVVLCAIGVGIAVASSGIIGFVGLVVPHCVRLITGPNHHSLLPLSALLGALLLAASDLFARLWISPAELPIGLVTALLGAPFFFVLLIQQRYRFQF